jgi:hypothetical protein
VVQWCFPRAIGPPQPLTLMFRVVVLQNLVASVLVPLCRGLQFGFVDVAENLRTSSLFVRNEFGLFGSRFDHAVITREAYCGRGVEEPATWVRLVTASHIDHFCHGHYYCVVTGDEFCVQTGDHPNVFLRQYGSSKYPGTPSIALGPRVGFDAVPDSARLAGQRPLMFNFMGSIRVDGMEPDRADLQRVLDATTWTVPTSLRVVKELVRSPGAEEQAEYRATLLSSSFTLSPVGTADDTFRFWEAVDAGSVPIFVRRRHLQWTSTKGEQYTISCPGAFEDVLATDPPIVLLDSWDDLPAYIHGVTEAHIDLLRRRLAEWRVQWWSNTTRTMDHALLRATAKRLNAAKSNDDGGVASALAELVRETRSGHGRWLGGGRREGGNRLMALESLAAASSTPDRPLSATQDVKQVSGVLYRK